MSDTDAKNILKESKYECEIRECYQECIENDMKKFAHLKNAEATAYWTTGEFENIRHDDNPLLLTQRKGIDPISFGYAQDAIEYYWDSYPDLSDERAGILSEGPGLPWLLHETINSDAIGLGEDFKVSMLTGNLFDPSQKDAWRDLPKTRGESCFFVLPYMYYGNDIWLRIMMNHEQAESVRSNQNRQIHDLLDKKMTDVFWWETRGEWTILNIVLGRWKIERLADIADWSSRVVWDEIQDDYERASSLNEYCDDDNYYDDDDHLSQEEQDWMDYTEHVIGW